MRPPPGYFETAGPAAEREIDYETVYGPGRTGPVAATGVSPLHELPAATAQESHSKENPEGQPPFIASDTTEDKGRSAISAVAVLPVQGASETGNTELTTAMREVLSSAGWPVLEKPRRDALTITGRVSRGPPEGGIQKVAIAWSVAAPNGAILGTIEQANTVPAGSVDANWGETATYAADAAASGIFELVHKWR